MGNRENREDYLFFSTAPVDTRTRNDFSLVYLRSVLVTYIQSGPTEAIIVSAKNIARFLKIYFSDVI